MWLWSLLSLLSLVSAVCRYDTSRLPKLKLDQNIAKRWRFSVYWLREWFGFRCEDPSVLHNDFNPNFLLHQRSPTPAFSYDFLSCTVHCFGWGSIPIKCRKMHRRAPGLPRQGTLRPFFDHAAGTSSSGCLGAVSVTYHSSIHSVNWPSIVSWLVDFDMKMATQ